MNGTWEGVMDNIAISLFDVSTSLNPSNKIKSL